MSAHTRLDQYQRTLQAVLDSEQQHKVAAVLPSLMDELRRLIKQIQECLLKHRIWIGVYGMPPVHEGIKAQQLTTDLVNALQEPGNVLGNTPDQIMQLRLQVQQAYSAWERTRNELEPQFSEFQRRWESEVSRLRTVAKIPDMLEPQAYQACVELTDKLLSYAHLDFSVKSRDHVARLASEWHALVDDFGELKETLSFEAIAVKFQLGPETISVLRELTSGQRVSLDHVSTQTLDELHQFQQFCKSVTLSFARRS